MSIDDDSDDIELIFVSLTRVVARLNAIEQDDYLTELLIDAKRIIAGFEHEPNTPISSNEDYYMSEKELGPLGST